MEKGFLSDLERKSNEPIALAFAGSGSVRNLSNFMGVSKWDEEGMRDEYRNDFSVQLAHEDGMITLDETGFPKKGRNSVGVSRQYCGATGKVDNCQVGVMTGYVSPNGYGLIDYELYIPEKWFNDDYAELRDKCGVPSKLEFRNKNDIASGMIREALESGLFPAKYVGVDSFYGNDSDFLDSLPEGTIYFADIKKNLLVFDGRPKMVTPDYSGRGRKDIKEKPEFLPRSVESIAKDSDLPWNDVVLDIGAKGPIITNDKYLMVTEVRDGKPGNDVWLYVRKLSDGKMKYALCNESPDASAEELRRPALMRWSIEQCFGECKGYLGMDHYESRSWVGWRRHMLLCLIAHLFIIKLRMEYNCEPPSSGPAPYIDEPVSLDDYLEAAVDMMNYREINHPYISAAPTQYQQVLTIGLIRALIDATFVKLGAVLNDINFRMKSAADAYDSHSKSTLNRAFKNHFGLLPDSG
jgi:SRSO17 transposase